jgi:hypothetical protein
MEITYGEPFQRPNFLDEIQTRVFLLAIQSHLLALRFLFLQTHATSYIFFSAYTVKEKGEKPDRKPFPMVNKIHTETSSLENSHRVFPET